MLKTSLLKLLASTNRMAQMLGSLNKEKVWSVIHSIITGVGWEWIDAFESGVLHNNAWKATSLDGRILMKRTE
jgi:hypothetical protein